ncbi:hypothetical protein ZH23_004599 [Salmonella enterica subsp. enterica]|nr:hypothetical protein [Salmonella enterica subsp. enterica serovar Poona]EED7686636.1 hypothetical protein [Salmonella enterica subsp. enterica serovar Poona]
MLPSETMIWRPEFTDKILSRKPGAVQFPLLPTISPVMTGRCTYDLNSRVTIMTTD